jgi:hypothetical protein
MCENNQLFLEDMMQKKIGSKDGHTQGKTIHHIDLVLEKLFWKGSS